MSKIKFRCSGCSKTLSVSLAHAGKVATCPQCGVNLKIPQVATESAAPKTPAVEKPSKSAPPEPPRNPYREDDYDELDDVDSYDDYDEFEDPAADDDDMGFGPVPGIDSDSGYDDLTESSSAGTARGQRTRGVKGVAGRSQTGGRQAAKRRDSGKSVVGAIVASMVAAFFCVVWLVVVAVTGRELGILAWGMGGAVGLVAGVIARNPSPLYCSIITCIAVMGVLAAKGLMLAFLSLMTFGVSMIEEMEMAFSPRQQKLDHAMADEMLENGQFDGLEKDYAEAWGQSYYSGDEDADDEMSEEVRGVAEQVQQKIRDELSQKSPEEEEQLLQAARDRHPEWIEDENHYLAMLHAMLQEEGTLTDELAAQARSELQLLDGDWDEEYSTAVDYEEQSRRAAQLRKMAAERLVGMTDDEKDQAIREALKEHPSWRPYMYAYTAMIEKLHNEGELTGDLAEHAKETVALQMTPDEYPDYFDEVSYEEQQARDSELEVIVSERLATLDTSAREALIEDAKTRYPDWYTGEGLFSGGDTEMQEALDEIGTDGTLWGNFLAVFSLFDVLWLFLCASTAYATTQKCGVVEAQAG